MLFVQSSSPYLLFCSSFYTFSPLDCSILQALEFILNEKTTKKRTNKYSWKFCFSIPQKTDTSAFQPKVFVIVFYWNTPLVCIFLFPYWKVTRKECTTYLWAICFCWSALSFCRIKTIHFYLILKCTNLSISRFQIHLHPTYFPRVLSFIIT